MHLPRLWTDAPVARNKSRGAKQQREQREHTRPTANTNRERRERKNQQNTTRKKGQVATTVGGAGKVGEDRAEEAAHITLE